MKKALFNTVKFLVQILALAFGFLGFAVLFVLALPIAGWNRMNRIFKRM
jgi:hypothetical protein